MKKPFLIIAAIAALALAVSGCGKKDEANADFQAPAPQVKTQTASQSRSAVYNLDYPGMVVSESEAKIVAKASGNAVNVKFALGDQVNIGQELMRIDDINEHGPSGSGFSAAQIKQAALAVSQAQSSYELARKNYDNMVLSSAKDLSAAEIAKNQAQTGQNNLNLTTAEAIKSAELAYDTAKTATESAKLNLDNKTKQLKQADSDSRENSATAADSAVATCGSIISNINGATGLDENNAVTISYSAQLGALDSATYSKAKDAYRAAKQQYDSYQKTNFSNNDSRVSAAIKVAETTRKLAEANQALMEKSVPSSNLPQGSLTALQTAAGAYALQANSALSQANGARQALENIDLNSQATIDSLTKAYELAKKQEAQAAQSLASLKAGNNSQLDQASFAFSSANNNYENLKVKLNSQLVAAKTQLDLAALQYQNAQVALQSLYDNRQVISPIKGFVTKKAIADGETVSAGQLLATVSQTENVKIQFFVDQEALGLITAGMQAEIKTGDKSFQALITGISPQADQLTKRFLVEAKPIDVKPSDLPLGTVVSVGIKITKNALQAKDEFILPLSAISVGQNASYIFVVENGQAKQVSVELGAVSGEFANFKAQLNDEAQIIVDGSRLLSDGQSVEIKN